MTTKLNKELLLRAYRMMRRIRDFEERVLVEFATGEISGFVHLYAGNLLTVFNNKPQLKGN